MRSTLARLRDTRENGDDGFTLIELLVVVVIIGILVAIAIPVYLNFRKGAENRSAQSDTRNAVTAIENCFNDGGQSYQTTNVAATSGPISMTCTSGVTGAPTGTASINVSTGNKMTYTYISSGTNAKTYTVATQNTDTGNTFTYTSATGQTVKS